MKLVKQSFEILTPINGVNMLQAIENAGRTCYKSEDKITDESAPKFVEMLINRGHESVLEHQSVSVRFVCDRGVSHEIVRHRLASFSQESTRYVGYSNKRPLKDFDCDIESDICNAYSQGFSMREISEHSSLTEWGVRKVLLENKIEIRGLNNKGNRIDDYFKNIDTTEKAYLLGLIQTDGNVRIADTKACLSITQHKDYYWYIKDMLLDFSNKVGEITDKNAIQLQIGSKNIVNDLINIGIVPNKSRVQTNENIDSLWNSIPEEYKGDFIRGLIDGDGYVTYFTQSRAVNESCNIGLCSTQEHLINLVIDFIKNKFNYTCGKGTCGNLYKLWITHHSKSIEIGNYLYKNFKYPFGHPKKASNWLKRLSVKPEIATYKDDKFKIICPTWLNSSSPQQIYTFIRCLDAIEDAYGNLRLSGWQPQQARAILPNCLKTEIVVTANLREWRTIFKQRTSVAAHPQMREIMNPLLDEFKKNIPVVFDDIK